MLRRRRWPGSVVAYVVLPQGKTVPSFTQISTRGACLLPRPHFLSHSSPNIDDFCVFESSGTASNSGTNHLNTNFCYSVTTRKKAKNSKNLRSPLHYLVSNLTITFGLSRCSSDEGVRDLNTVFKFHFSSAWVRARSRARRLAGRSGWPKGRSSSAWR